MNTKTSTENKNEVKPRRGESGQAIVLMALVAVLLLAALGLAVDGGGLYFLWRDATNATDAAVMAATYARCTHGDIVKAGLQAAAQNGFDNNGSSNTVTINSPPIDGSGVGNPNYIQVNINAKKPAYFIQIVHKDPLQITTRAVGFCIPPLDPATVPAIFGGSTTCSNAVNFANSTSNVTGGLWSNTDLKISGSDNNVQGDSGAVGGVEGNNTTWTSGSPPTPTSPPPGGSDPKTDPLSLQLATYAPNGTSANRAAGSGLYDAIFSTADDPDYKNGVWNPDNGRQLEGLYYVDGDVTIGVGVDVNGDRNNDGRHDGLTIVATGTISMSVGPGKDLSYYTGGGGDGLIAFSGAGIGRPCGFNAVDISGSNATWVGVIYAPFGGVNMDLSTLNMRGALIGNTISMHGSDFTLVADPTLIPPRPPSVNMAE